VVESFEPEASLAHWAPGRVLAWHAFARITLRRQQSRPENYLHLRRRETASGKKRPFTLAQTAEGSSPLQLTAMGLSLECRCLKELHT
jgi:hypothetical protein